MSTSNLAPAPKPVAIRLPFKIMGGFIALIFLSIPVMGAIGLYKKYVKAASSSGQTAAVTASDYHGIDTNSVAYLIIIGPKLERASDACLAAARCGTVGTGQYELGNIAQLPACLQARLPACQAHATEVQALPPSKIVLSWPQLVTARVTVPFYTARLLKEMVDEDGVPDIAPYLTQHSGRWTFVDWAPVAKPEFTDRIQALDNADATARVAMASFDRVLNDQQACGQGVHCTAEKLFSLVTAAAER